MASDYEIGRIVAVDTSQVTIEISREIKALTRSTYEGTVEVGSINSYVIIPVGARRIVAMVTRVVLTEEGEIKADKTMVVLPSSRRLMRATMIGTIDEEVFRQGINLFPTLDAPVFITTKEDLDAIFGGKDKSSCHSEEDDPGYCISIGQSAVFPEYKIKINPDSFFGKHAAIIGSTGSGKSCSIATILQSILEHNDVNKTRFIILDTNGEYRAAFQQENVDGNFSSIMNSLYIPTDPLLEGNLKIPYWFMNSDDFIRLFKAAPGVQMPVLLNALSSARNYATKARSWMQMRDDVITELHKINAYCAGGDRSDAKSIRQLSDGMINYLSQDENKPQIDELCLQYDEIKDNDLVTAFTNFQRIVREGISNEGGNYESYATIDINKRSRIETIVGHLPGIMVKLPKNKTEVEYKNISADTPTYFSKNNFRYQHLEHAMSHNESQTNRARDNSSTMLMRIYRLLEDSRYEFLFGPKTEWPAVKHSLATFLRDVLGEESQQKHSLSNEEQLSNDLLPFYDRQRSGAQHSNVVIIDLSLLAIEVLENVTALIGRLIHEFLQRISDKTSSGVNRGDYPIVLILEEAQNYIREGGKSEESSISRQVFERIAREGRKYGLGLVIASQRPSELSKTVLSQCNSFVVHRLHNPEDLKYFREILPGIYSQLLDQLPALAPRNALVLGECVQAPALVEMREANPTPKSHNPQFFRSWSKAKDITPNIEAVCAKWEGNNENE